MRASTGLIVCVLAATSLALAGDANAREQQQQQEILEPGAKYSSKLPSWAEFQKLYHKHYASTSERLARFKVFLSNLMRASVSQAEYKLGKSAYYLAVNKYSDKATDELRNKFGSAPDAAALEVSRKMDGTSPGSLTRRRRAAPNIFGLFGAKKSSQVYLDWRQQEPSCLHEPADQGECNSCYAMASVRLFEWHYCRQRAGELLKFSEQFMVDCGHLSGLGGCRSGSQEKTMDFIGRHGFVPASQAPYVGVEQECALTRGEGELRRLRVSGLNYQVVKMSAWAEELERQPLIMFMYLSDGLFDYGGGVYETKSAGECDSSLGHFLLVVGHGIERGKEYWLLSDNFGSDWGDSGYLRVSKTNNHCLGYALRAAGEFTREQRQQ